MANKDFKISFPSEDYDAIIKSSAMAQGWSEKVRGEEGVIDNPVKPEDFLTERLQTAYVTYHIGLQSREAGETARANAVSKVELDLRKKFKVK